MLSPEASLWASGEKELPVDALVEQLNKVHQYFQASLSHQSAPEGTGQPGRHLHGWKA